MGWKTKESGSSHAGKAAAVLADGSEPKPVYFDVGSGSYVPKSSDWWVYDGTLGAPLASDLRGSCSCGWRGSTLFPLDWAQVAEEGSAAYDTSGPYEEWAQHMSEITSRSVPLPADLEALVDQLDKKLDALTDEAPLAALKIVAALERIAGRVAPLAAHYVQADEIPWEAIAEGLGLTEKDARSRLLSYSLRH
jgi:hypothetical protein